MPENKNYKLIKVAPNSILFDLHPLANSMMTRRIYLTNENKTQILPLDWALGIFQDASLFDMYQKGYFTFDDNESLVKAAYEAGVYFGDTLEFTPAKPDLSINILGILKSGNRANILKEIETNGQDMVKDVAISHVDELPHAIVRMLEDIFKVQLTIDEQ